MRLAKKSMSKKCGPKTSKRLGNQQTKESQDKKQRKVKNLYVLVIVDKCVRLENRDCWHVYMLQCVLGRRDSWWFCCWPDIAPFFRAHSRSSVPSKPKSRLRTWIFWMSGMKFLAENGGKDAIDRNKALFFWPLLLYGVFQYYFFVLWVWFNKMSWLSFNVSDGQILVASGPGDG